MHYVDVITAASQLNIVYLCHVGAIHRYYESRRRAFNDSRPERRVAADAAKRKAKRKLLRQNVRWHFLALVLRK